MRHSLAYVQDDCTIGADCQIWQFASVLRRSLLGDHCVISPYALVDGCQLGDAVHVGSHASLNPGAMIDDDVFIGPHVVLCNDAWPRTHKTNFDSEALISRELVTIRIDYRASIGARAVLLPGTRVGAFAMVAAGAVCQGDVPAHSIFMRDGTLRTIKDETARSIKRMRSYDK